MKTKIMLAILAGITWVGFSTFADTLLTGTLLNYNDEPIKEGFVLSEDDPTFWALTDHDGGFTIQRSSTNEITSLTASGAGCVVTNVAITNTHQSGIVIKLAQQDSAFTSIEMGCAIRTSRECASRRIVSQYNLFKDSVHALSAADQLCISNYEAFLASTGEAIITKILNTNALSAAELEYETLMYAEIAARSYSDTDTKNFCKALITDAKTVLQKGYEGLPLDSDDIHFLRVYRAMMGIYSPVNNALPGDAGYAEWGPELKHLIPDVGDTPPEIAVLDWKPLLDRSNHTDTSFLNLTESLRLESLYDPLSSFASYDYDEGTGWLVPRDKDALQEYYPFEQGSMRNLRAGADGKPTMFILTVFEDRTSPTKRMRFAAYIRGAYGDQVNVVSVCQPSPLYGDMVIDEFNYYGPNTNANLSHGLRYRWGDEDITPARQARTVKIACMENLNIGGDITLSLNGGPFREIWAPGQYIKMILLDKNGVKSSAYDAALFVESGGGWWEDFTYTYDAPYHPFDNYYNFEQNIRALIDHDGEYDAAISDQGFFPTYPSKQFGIPYQFKVTSIDSGESLVHADWILPTYSTNGIADKYNYTDTTNANVSFKFAADTRILLHDTVVYNRDPAEGSTCTTGSITDLEVDGIYYFDFEINETAPPLVTLKDGYDEQWKDRTNRLEAISMKPYFGTTCTVARVQNYMLGDVKDVGAHSLGTSIPFYGHITQIDGDVITVVMPESDLDDFHGYTFWKEAGADADPLKDYKQDPAVEIQLAAATRWNEGGTAGRTYQFKVDPATRVMVNGNMYKSFSDLAVGQYVFVEYQAWQEEQNQSQGILFPETIMAALPLGAILPSIQTDVSSLSIPEGSTDAFQVRLTSEPTASVTVTVSRVEGGDTNLTVQSGSSLTFTTNNWGTYQPVTLAAAEDADFDNGSAVFRCASVGLSDLNVTAAETDNETDPAYSLPWSENFEDRTVAAIDGQNGWTGDAGADVQTGTVYGGSKALAATGATASHTFLGSASNIWVTFQMQPTLSERPPDSIPAGASAVFYVNTDRQLVAYDATNATVISSPVLSSGWNKIAISCDYVSGQWSLELNDAQAVTDFDFHGSPAAFGAIELTDGSTNTTYVDAITVSETSGETPAPDTDSDGIPDSWETIHYGGATNAVATNLCANGLNTIREAYIAGLNPTNAQSQFVITDLAENILQWNGISGRVYTVFWTSNLLTSFQPLETNVAWTAVPFTDTNHPGEEKGFYKIEVELEE